MFRLLLDAERYPNWLGDAHALFADGMRPTPGDIFDHGVGVGQIGELDSTSVAGEEPWRRLDLVVRVRRFLVVDVRFELEPAGSGTCVRMTVRPRGLWRPVAPLISPLARMRNERWLTRLSRQLEEPADS